MTFREAFDAIVAIAITRDDTVNLQVEAWHSHGSARSAEVSVWSGVDGQHYRGDSYEAVVAAYAARIKKSDEVDALIGGAPELPS